MAFALLGFALTLLAPAAAAQQILVFPSAVGAHSIPATLLKPDGNGPFGAVVVMHDCSGLGPPQSSSGAPNRWGEELRGQGYVALIPDSFSPRGVYRGVCTATDAQTRAATNGAVRAADAYGALAALRDLAFVDGRRIGLMGGSHGGWATLVAMVAADNAQDPLQQAKLSGFSAAVALYPSCLARYGEWSTKQQNGNRGPMVSHSGVYRSIGPLLILAGEKDDWTPAEPCRQLVETARSHGQPLEIRIFPGAHHAFDSEAPLRYVAQRNNPSSPDGRGATTGGDPMAWAEARRQVADFFALHLGRPQAQRR